MLDLVRFELKKLLVRRTSLIACAGILVMLCGIMTLNIVQTKTTSSADEVLSGTAAIAYQKEKTAAHEGVLTVERVQDEVAAYQELAFSKVDPADVSGLSDQAAYTLMNQAYDEDEFRAIYDAYYSYLFSPWKEGALEPYQVAAQLNDGAADGFYEAIADKLQRTLDDGMGGTWVYSDAERAYWTEKQDAVGEPLAYGYAGGWSDVLACLAFFAFAMVAVCVALTPVFAGEYQDRTDAVLLSSRYVRWKRVAAKVIAALVFATAYFALATLIIMGAALAFFGAEGGDLPVQVLSLGIPYDLTMAEATWTAVGIAYLMTLGFAALTLLLSSKLRSQLAIFVACAALIFLTGMVPSGGNAVLLHALYLFPLNALVDQVLFNALVSYEVGPFVVDLMGLLVCVYALVLIVCVPLAARAFRRHQVV